MFNKKRKKDDGRSVASGREITSDELMDCMIDGFCLIDINGNLVSCNQAYAEMFGFGTPGDAVGINVIETIAYREIPRVMGEFKRCLEVGARAELEFIARDQMGREFPVQVNSKVKRDENGNVLGNVGVIRDVTESKNAEMERLETSIRSSEDQIKKLETEWDLMFRLSMDIICIAGFDGYMKRMSPAAEKILGWAVEELMAKPYVEFVHPEDREATAGAAGKLSKGLEVISFQNRYLCKDGSYRWLDWNSTPLYGENIIIAIARDVTDQKKAQDELEEKITELDRFRAATIEREFRMKELRDEVDSLKLKSKR